MVSKKNKVILKYMSLLRALIGLMIAAITLGFFIGILLVRFLGMPSYCLAVGVLLGVALGFYGVYKQLVRMIS